MVEALSANTMFGDNVRMTATWKFCDCSDTSILVMVCRDRYHNPLTSKVMLRPMLGAAWKE